MPVYENTLALSTDKKLTEWSNEPSVTKLKEDLHLAKPAHDLHVTRVERWLNLRNIEGSAKPKGIANRSSVQPKLIRRQAEWRYAALSEPFLSAKTMFKISPTTFEDRKGAEQNSLVLGWQFRTQINRVKFIDDFVRTTVDEGTCAVRLGWQRETKIEKTEVPVWEFAEVSSEEEMMALQQAAELKSSNYNGFLDLPEDLREAVNYTMESGVPVIARAIGTEVVEKEVIVRNRPTLDILHYENLYLDPSADGDIQKAGFAILSFETSKAEMLKDGRYSNLDKVNWAANTPTVHADHATQLDESQAFSDELRKRVVAYEYWGWYDVGGNDELVPIVATWVGDTMVRMEETPYPDKELPIVIVPYLPVKKSITGEPDAELLEENQAILGAVTRGMIDLMGRSANGQTGFAKGMLDVVNKRRYDKGLDYDFNPGMHPQNSIYHHQYPEIPNSALTMLSLQNQEAEALSGVKAFSGGLSGAAYGDVAAGIRGMLDAASKREMAILRRLAKGIEDIGRKIISMNQVFLSEEETIRITNEEFVKVRREDLAGQYDVEVDIATAEVEEAQAQDLSFMLQTIGNSMDPAMMRMILSQIAKLKRMPELAKMIETFEPKPDPVAQKMQEIELAKLQAELDEVTSKAELNRARARRELATADIQDLDFVEQETGTKHARAVDLHGAQAEANQQLEITKNLLNPNSPLNGGRI